MMGALLIAFLVVPILEIYVIIKVGGLIGAVPTLVLLLGISILGASLVRREGGRAWRAFQEAVASGRVPGREVADGALLLIGGALLLAPGFVTDAVGLVLVLPVTRPLARRLLWRLARGRVLVVGGPATRWAAGRYGRSGPTGRVSDDVIEGEVVDERRPGEDTNGPGHVTRGG